MLVGNKETRISIHQHCKEKKRHPDLKNKKNRTWELFVSITKVSRESTLSSTIITPSEKARSFA